MCHKQDKYYDTDDLRARRSVHRVRPQNSQDLARVTCNVLFLILKVQESNLGQSATPVQIAIISI